MEEPQHMDYYLDPQSVVKRVKRQGKLATTLSIESSTLDTKRKVTLNPDLLCLWNSNSKVFFTVDAALC